MATPIVSFGADVGGFVTSTTITGVDVGSGGNRIALIALGASNVNDDPVSVSVGTDSLTAQGSGIYTDPSGWKFRLFALELTVTGSQDITATWDDGFNVKWIAGCVLPDSALPIGDLTPDEASIGSRQPFGTIDSAAGDTVVALFFLDSASTFSATSPAAALSGTGIGGTSRVHGMYRAGGSPSVTIAGTVTTGPNIWRGFAFNVPAAGGGDTTAPTITGPTGAAGASSISLNVAENTTACGTWTANEAVTWSISGPDAALFSIGASTGVLAFVSPPDFEAPGDAGANNTYDLTVTATDGASNVSTQTVAINVTDAAEDSTNPSAPGTPTFGSVTKNSATVSWTAATDNVAVAGYERRVASGSIVDVGNVLTFNLTGGTPGASVLVEVRAYDAAGNRGAWASATLTYLIWGFDFDDPALDLEIGNVSGTLVGLGMVSSTAWTIRVSDVDTGALVHTFSASTDAAGVLPRLEHAALDGEVYEVRGMTTEVDPLDRLVWAAILEATTP